MANTLISNWIAKSEPDYYTMFIKAWIPFNAWYYKEYSTKKDDKAITEMCATSNKIRDRIEALIKNDDNESRKFKQNLAFLQKEFNERSIKNYNKIISFDSISLSDYFPEAETLHKRGIIYKAIPHKTNGFRATVVSKDNSKTYMDKTFNPYSIETLTLDNQFISLNSTMRNNIKEVFVKIDPNKPFSLISKSRISNEYILLDKDIQIKFINNSELIAKAIIQILYNLRCILFHGQLDPTDTNKAVYEYAFHLLKPIIKELK